MYVGTEGLHFRKQIIELKSSLIVFVYRRIQYDAHIMFMHDTFVLSVLLFNYSRAINHLSRMHLILLNANSVQFAKTSSFKAYNLGFYCYIIIGISCFFCMSSDQRVSLTTNLTFYIIYGFVSIYMFDGVWHIEVKYKTYIILLSLLWQWTCYYERSSTKFMEPMSHV